MLRRFFNCLNFVGRLRARRAAIQRFDAESAEFRRKSRARITELAANGQGPIAYAENAALFGIDVNNRERPRLVGFNGVRIRD